MTSPAIPTVAIINTSEEITALLTAVFQMEGFRTVAAYVPDMKRGETDLTGFLREYQPAAVIFDIALPYEENWAYFQSIQQSESGRAAPFILTTTNKRALEGLVGPTPAHEVIGKPYDLEQLVEAVRRAIGRPEGA